MQWLRPVGGVGVRLRRHDDGRGGEGWYWSWKRMKRWMKREMMLMGGVWSERVGCVAGVGVGMEVVGVGVEVVGVGVEVGCIGIGVGVVGIGVEMGCIGVVVAAAAAAAVVAVDDNAPPPSPPYASSAPPAHPPSDSDRYPDTPPPSWICLVWFGAGYLHGGPRRGGHVGIGKVWIRSGGRRRLRCIGTWWTVQWTEGVGEGRWRIGGVGFVGVVVGVGIGGVVVVGVETGIDGVNRGPTTEMCKGVADGCADSTTPVSGHPNNHVDEGVDIWGCVGDGLKGVV